MLWLVNVNSVRFHVTSFYSPQHLHDKVGGGPTGVEFAAELSDFIREDCTRLYPGIAKYARVILVEAGGNGMLNALFATDHKNKLIVEQAGNFSNTYLTYNLIRVVTVLSAFDNKLRDYALKKLTSDICQVRLGHRVQEVGYNISRLRYFDVKSDKFSCSFI